MATAKTARMATAKRARKARPRRRSTIRWDRVGRYALLAVLGTILLLYVPPARRWITQSATAGHQQAELEDLQQEHERLRTRLRALKVPGALEREARRLGMVKVGERGFVIENLGR
jgi:cell division protein FtsB